MSAFSHFMYNQAARLSVQLTDKLERMSEMKSGDWLCVSCQAHNFVSRKQCYKCAALPGAGSFYKKISGKRPQQAFAAHDAALAAEIE